MSAPRILIIEGDLAEAQNLEEAIFEIPERDDSEGENPRGSGLSRRYWWNARIIHSTTLAGGLDAVRAGESDLVLLNPSLPEQGGVEAYRWLKIQAPDLPVILLLDDVRDETIGHTALREGAQDFLLKSQCDWESLAHAMENAIDRARLGRAMWKTFLTDPATGLPNRQGFTYLAETLQAVCRPSQTPLRMVAAAFDDPAASEATVLYAAQSLRAATGAGDLLGKLGPMQFGVLSGNLDAAELRERMRGAPPLQWSEWRPEPDSKESADSVDRLIAGAEMLLDQRLSRRAVH